MSAFGGKADINHDPAKGPLLANSGHEGSSQTNLLPRPISFNMATGPVNGRVELLVLPCLIQIDATKQADA